MSNPSLPADDVFRLILSEVKDFAMFLLDGDGRVETWNIGAERIFGYTVDDIRGRHFSILFTAEDRAHEVPAKELDTARKTGRAEDTRWHVRKDGKYLFADGVTTAVRDAAGTVLGFAKICRDITDRYRSEQRLAAQLALTNLLNQEVAVEETARRVMQAICENLGWDFGALWMVEEDKIRCVEHWHESAVDDAIARELCSVPLNRGKGLPGIVWDTGKALWVTEADFSDPTRFPRAVRARGAGLHAAFGFPIVHHGEVAGVMEFFSRQQREPDQPLMPVMTLIGSQIGEYMERRRTAQALRESEERYRVVSETAQDAIFTIDEASRILFCNRAVERMYGYAPGELIGKTLDIIMPERFRESHRRGIERYLKTKQKRIPWTGVELPSMHRDGHEFPTEISFGEWSGDDGKTVFTGYARDITERKRAAEELSQTLEMEKQARTEAEAARAQLQRRADEEASFRHLASALTGAVEMSEVLYEITNRATLVTRADGVYVERIINPSRTVEVVASAGRGTPPRGLRVGFPGSMTEEIIRGGEPVILADMRSFGRSMAPYLLDTCGDCEVLVTPLVGDDEPLGALVLLNSRSSGRTFRDSDVVRARTLGDLTSLALRRVRHMEQEREAKEKAEAAVRVRDETLGIVSHDLRNPLTQIVLSADLLAATAPDDQRDLVETIRSASRRMDRLIQDLLDVARVEAGRLAVQPTIISSEQLIHDVCEANRPLIDQKNIRLTCNIEGPLPDICGDRERLIQVFGNLIGNALKFTPPRGAITVDARADGKLVEFRVTDTGPGIPEADLGNIFKPYWQAKKTAHMGAGLGLAIVRGIIEAHGGRVWAGNAPAGGAMFTLTVPRA